MHDEDERGPEQQIGNVKKILRAANFSVKDISLANGLGNEIPEDADLVMIIGAQTEFSEEEVRTLNEYRKTGGSLLIALEPGGASLSGLLEPLGLRFDSQTQTTSDIFH